MFAAEFEYYRAGSVAEVSDLLSKHPGAKLLAGGHSLLPMMKLRLAEPAHLIDINGIDALKGIDEADGKIVIGAMTTENELIASPLLQEKCPLLPEAAALTPVTEPTNTVFAIRRAVSMSGVHA